MSPPELPGLLQSALDAAPVGICVLDADLRVLYVNPRLAAMFGGDAGRLLGGDATAGVGRAVREDLARRLRNRLAGGAVELRSRFRDGDLDVHVDSILTTVEGKPAVLYLAMPVTAEAEGDDEQVLDHLAAAVSAKTGEDFFTTLVITLCTMLGVDYAMVAEVDAAVTQVQMIAFAADGRIVPGHTCALAGTPCNEVLRAGLQWFTHGVQEEFPADALLGVLGAQAYAGVPLRDSAGASIGVVAIGHRQRLPRTGRGEAALQILANRAGGELERRRRERELRRANAYLDDLIDTASVMIVEIDTVGRLVRANRCFEETMGWSRAELQGGDWLDRLQPPDRFPEGAARVREYLRSGRWPREVEAKLLTRGGEQRIVVWRNSEVRDGGGGVLGTLSVGTDITEALQAQEERERLLASLRRNETLSAVGSLVAGVAHEVRNPLFGISATLDAFAAELGGAPAAREYFAVLRRDVDRLRRLMNDLLEYGRPQPLSLQVQPLAPLLHEAVRGLRPRAAEREVALAVELREPLPQLPLDGDRVLQVVKNVLENAVAFSPAGGTVRAELAFDAATRELRFTVTDRGPGFAAADLPRIFEPFWSRRPGGSGLGLAIVQKIVGEHGGSVRAFNDTAGGAGLEVRLPTTVEAPAMAQSDVGQSTAGR